MQQIRTAILGYGLSGRIFHAPFLRALDPFQVCAIVTADPAKQALARLDFPNVSCFDTAEALWADEALALDLVILCTPNASHFDLAHTALLHGKHVVMEKPFTVTAEEGRQLDALANSKQLCLSVYHNRRYDGDFKTIQSLIAQNTLGRLVQLESRFDRFRPALKDNAWREAPLAGSGILYDLGSHLIDQALVLFGRPQSLYCECLNQRSGAVDDGFAMTLTYDKGPRVLLSANSFVLAPSPRFALYGTEGNFIKYGLDPQEPTLRHYLSQTSDKGNDALLLALQNPNWGAEDSRYWGQHYNPKGSSPITTENGDYKAFYEGVAAAILTQQPVPINAQAATQVIELIEAAFESHRLKAHINL